MCVEEEILVTFGSISNSVIAFHLCTSWGLFSAGRSPDLSWQFLHNGSLALPFCSFLLFRLGKEPRNSLDCVSSCNHLSFQTQIHILEPWISGMLEIKTKQNTC